MLVAFSVTPLGSPDAGSGDDGAGVGKAVAAAVQAVRAAGLPTETNAMFTLVEGEWDEVMAAVRAAVDAVAAAAPRVSLVLKADIRPEVTDALHSKVATVERYLST